MILAKKENGKEQSLFEHSLNVFNFVKNEFLNNEIYDFNCDLFKISLNLNKDELEKILFLVSFFHDIGKGSKEFQEKITIQKRKEILPHQLISILILKAINIEVYIQQNFNINNKSKLEEIKNLIEYLILYHHSKNFKETNYDQIKISEIISYFKKNEESFIVLKENINLFLSELNNSFKTNFVFNEEDFFYLRNKKSEDVFICFKKYNNYIDDLTINFESVKNVLRFIFNLSDRKESSIFKNEKIEIKHRQNKQLNIFSKLDDFIKNEKTIAQNNVVEEIKNKFLNNSTLILDGAPGVGKTRIFYKIFQNLNKENQNDKMIIITPRNAISKYLFLELKNKEYLIPEKIGDSFLIEIINSEYSERIKIFKNQQNEIEIENVEIEGFFNSNIVFISVDKLIQTYNDNKILDSFITIKDSYVVFDEFHEIFDQPLLSVYFKEILNVFEFFKTKVLLTSGTINKPILSDFLKIKNLENKIINLNSFNENEIKINFLEDKGEVQNLLEDFKNKKENAIFIFNTAIQAQRETLKIKDLNENLILFHSLYRKEDKEELFNQILTSFKTLNNQKILLSGPIVQASLNITTDKMFTEKTNAENFLQRVGRLNRFGEIEKSNLFILNENYLQIKDKKFLNEENLQKEFLNYLTTMLMLLEEEEEKITMNILRKIYSNFSDSFQTNMNLKFLLEEKIELIYEEARSFYQKIDQKYPLNYKNKKDKKPQCLTSLIKNGLRGKGGFICQVPVFQINETKKILTKQGAFDTILNYETVISTLSELNFSIQKKEKIKENEIVEFINVFNSMKKKSKYIKGEKEKNAQFLMKMVNFENTPIPVFIEDLTSSNSLELKNVKYETKNEFEQFIYLEKNSFKLGIIKLKELI